MNVLILGDGPDELAWARALIHHPEHRLVAACPGFKDWPDLPGGHDLNAALAIAEVDAVIVGGGPELRGEALRRAAGEGLAIIALHPPGPNTDPYYHVALSRQETGALVVPDLPARLHPGVAALDKAMHDGPPGSGRVVRLDAWTAPEDGDLVGTVTPRQIDAVRALIGEIEAVTATGTPPGDRPTERLVIHLRGSRGRTAEIRLETGPPEPTRLAVSSSPGSTTLEFDPAFLGSSRLVRRSPGEADVVTEIAPWNPKDAILHALSEAVAGREFSPNLLDGTRAMEVTEAVGRSLRRGRTIDLDYEEMSEAGNFKSVMTATGCALLVGILLILPIALIGPVFGVRWTIYLAYIIPPVLSLFVLLQLLRLGLKSPGSTVGASVRASPAGTLDDDRGSEAT